jgi:Secretion system C-terminal sorting domain/Outer membrane protein Omp28
MKHISTSILAAILMICFQTTSFAQYKKYVLAEHFTNTKCGICAGKNPILFTAINQYTADVHHISVHPSTPYNTCALYLANTTENQGRANYYSIQGTPQLFLNGTAASINNQLAAKIGTLTTATSPLYIEVKNTTTATGRHGKITLRTNEVLPAGTYKLHVALLEKTLNYSSPNGETVHHNVMRDFWGTNGAGLDFTLPTPGNETVIEQDFTLNSTWVANEMYLLAYVQNTATKEIINSGSEFDPIVTGVEDNFKVQKINFTPNPATDVTRINAGENMIEQVELFDLSGKQIVSAKNIENTQFDLNLTTCKSGIYIAKVTTKEGVYSQKLVKI